MESSPLRVIPLSLSRDTILQVQGACEGTTRSRGCGLEESRIVALGYDVIHILKFSNCNICVAVLLM